MRRLSLLLATLVLTSCGTTPAPAAFAPEAVARVRYLPGGAASGTGAAWTLELQVRWLDRMPQSGLQPLLSRVRMISVGSVAEPVRGHTTLASHGRIGGGDAAVQLQAELDAGRLANQGPATCLRLVARPGTCTRVELGPGAFGPAPHGIACEIVPVSDGHEAEVLLELSGVVAQAKDQGPVVEVARLRLADPLTVASGGLLLLVPEPASGHVYALHLRARPEPPDPDALAAAAEQLRQAEGTARLERASRSAADWSVLEFENAVDSLVYGNYQRSALVFLTRVGRAPLAADLALVADTLLLLRWSAAVHAELEPHPRGAAPALAWTVERTAVEALLRALARDALTAPLRSILLRHTGELGNAPDLLAEVTAQCRDVAEFQRRVRDENKSFLADPDPGSRARASDWLLARGLLPAGFDPLGPLASRRAALDAAEAAEARR